MLQLTSVENKLRTNKVTTLFIVGGEDELKKTEMTVSMATNMKLKVLKGRDHLNDINDPLF